MLASRYKYDKKSIRRLNDVQINAKKRIEEKIERGVYHFEQYDCECGTKFDDLELLGEKDRYGLYVQTRICPNCGLIMTNPRMTQDSYNDFYDSDYRPLYTADECANELFFNDQIEHGRSIVKWLKHNRVFDGGMIKSVLEIGTGAGGILYGIKELYKDIFELGIDLGNEYIEYGVKKGLNLKQMDVQTLLPEKKQFDLIILSHVLEHFLDLRIEMNAIKELLSEKGILYVEVPGLKNIPNVNVDFLEYLQNAHIRCFSLNTLNQVMARYGFECLAGDECVSAVYKVGQENNQLKNYYDETINYLKTLERRNFWLTHIKKPMYLKYKKMTSWIIQQMKNK